ncbi:hypothetical protein [Jiangella anatolica]|uniref:Uncharacterized protein n=1 Tax=Jiangella anatolica TaxID=2670374 RepID=A0A2W2BW50_9ACTN|nr:hypothetical protein [Jiangella anatolica]PZF84168.1 hypothetical protein C1I92_09975 [Jiangella anatolica]
MKWDWKLVAGQALHCAAYMTNSVANFFESVHVLIEADADRRAEEAAWVNAFGEQLNSLPETEA